MASENQIQTDLGLEAVISAIDRFFDPRINLYGHYLHIFLSFF